MADLLVKQMPKGFPVWPDNMAVTDAWLVVCTQWNATSMVDGRMYFHGLNYTGAGEGLNRAEVVLTADQWAGLRMMERIAAAVLNGNRG